MTTTDDLNSFDIIAQRWPLLFKALEQTPYQELSIEIEQNTIVVNNTQLTSNYDRVAEAELQTSRINEFSNVAYIYGSALGDTARILLARKAIRQLNVVILNKSVFIQSLYALAQADWLCDSRVQLYLAQDFEDIKQPFCVNPAELKLCEKEAEFIADCIQIELNHDYIEKKHNKTNASSPIKRNIEFIKNDPDISALNIPQQPEIFIAAAGPSLELHLDYLKKNQVFIIALDASVAILLANNITPNIVVSIDYKAFQFFANIPASKLEKVPLVYFPNVETEVLSYWPGPRYCSYSETKMYQNIAKAFPKRPLYCAGSVIHPAIDLAAYLNVKAIILLGADFAFIFNKSHARNGLKVSSHELDLETAQETICNGYGEIVPTMTSLKGYLRDLERYIATHKNIKFYVGSLHGAKIEGTTLWNK